MVKITLKQKILLVIFGIFLFLVLLELGLRLGGFVLLSVQEYENKRLLRQGGAYRIICLGESTTFGDYPEELQNILNESICAGKFNIATAVNLGRPSTDTDVILSQLEDNLNTYKPHIVITMMGINDSGDFFMLGSGMPGEKKQTFLRTLKVYKLIMLLRLHLLNKLKVIENDNLPGPESIPANIDCLSPAPFYLRKEQDYREGRAIEPQDCEIYAQLALCYIDHQQDPQKDQEAEAMLKDIIKACPKYSLAYIFLGMRYDKQNKYALAEEMYKMAIDIDPANPDNMAYHDLTWFYERHGRYSEAEEVLKKAIKISYVDDRFIIALGKFYRKHGKYIQAEEIFKKLIDKYPDAAGDGMFYGDLALTYEGQGNWDLAEKYFRKAKNMQSKYYNQQTQSNYRRLKETLGQRGIQLVCVQYPMRSIEPLKKLFPDKAGIIFVDNEKIFKDAVRREGYDEYFNDNFAGDFGHCTPKGDRLLAENIAKTILKEYFKID